MATLSGLMRTLGKPELAELAEAHMEEVRLRSGTVPFHAETPYGTVTSVGLDTGHVSVRGSHAELWAWAHRSGAGWPCSTLTDYACVEAVLDGRGDLIDLLVWSDFDGVLVERDSSEVDIMGDELTAWIDDCLRGTSVAHLMRGV